MNNVKITLIGLIGVMCLLFTSCKDTGSTTNKIGDGTTERGYPFTTHINSDGEKAQVGDEIYFHLEVLAKDSLLYDSRTDRQAGGRAQRFKLLPASDITDKANPLLDVFPMMSNGDSLTLYFPADSLPQLPPGLENEEFVAYNIAVKAIVRSEHMNGADRLESVKSKIEQNIADFKASKLSDLLELQDGYKVLIHEEGTGIVPKTGDYVQVQYYGALKDDGTEFDNSFKRNTPFVFRVNKNEVIRGWDIAASSLKRGTKATLFIPSTLAYGDRDNGPIKANSDLVFYVEIL